VVLVPVLRASTREAKAERERLVEPSVDEIEAGELVAARAGG
jgi:hypothetical protein